MKCCPDCKLPIADPRMPHDCYLAALKEVEFLRNQIAAAEAAAYKRGMEAAAEICWNKGLNRMQMLSHEHGYMYGQGYDAATEDCYRSIKEEAEKP